MSLVRNKAFSSKAKPYYARAHSNANGYLNKPSTVPNYLFLFTHSYVEDRLTGAFQSNAQDGVAQVFSSAGPVYSAQASGTTCMHLRM